MTKEQVIAGFRLAAESYVEPEVVLNVNVGDLLYLRSGTFYYVEFYGARRLRKNSFGIVLSLSPVSVTINIDGETCKIFRDTAARARMSFDSDTSLT